MSESKPKLTLYHWKISYFSAIARLALSEASLSYDSHLITLADHSNSNPEYIKLNPKGTVPTLVIESSNGKQKVFTESRDILNYAVSIHASLDGGHEARAFVERFYKGDLAYDVATGIAAPEQKRKDLVEKWAERVDNAEERMRKAGSEEERKKYEEKRAVNAAKVAQFPTLGPPWGEEKADWMLGELETYLLKDGKDPSKDFLCSKEFSQADICAIVMLDRLAAYGYEGKVWGPGKHEAIAKYVERVRARDSYKDAVLKWGH